MDLKDYKLHKLEELTLLHAHLHWRYCPGDPGNIAGPPDAWCPPTPDEIDFAVVLIADGKPDLDITEYLSDVEVQQMEDVVRSLVEDEIDQQILP